MEYVILEDKDGIGREVFKILYKSEKKQKEWPTVPWQVIALFYWKEVADAYIEFCNKCGHLNSGNISL